MDIVVTCPKDEWDYWLSEGAAVGEPTPEDTEYHWILRAGIPKIELGERVYIVAHGKLRGYAPLVAIRRDCEFHLGNCLAREGGAVAVTLRCIACEGKRRGIYLTDSQVTSMGALAGHEIRTCGVCLGSGIALVRGFQGFRYRWWEYADEIDFPLWRTP